MHDPWWCAVSECTVAPSNNGAGVGHQQDRARQRRAVRSGFNNHRGAVVRNEFADGDTGQRHRDQLRAAAKQACAADGDDCTTLADARPGGCHYPGLEIVPRAFLGDGRAGVRHHEHVAAFRAGSGATAGHHYHFNEAGVDDGRTDAAEGDADQLGAVPQQMRPCDCHARAFLPGGGTHGVDGAGFEVGPGAGFGHNSPRVRREGDG